MRSPPFLLKVPPYRIVWLAAARSHPRVPRWMHHRPCPRSDMLCSPPTASWVWSSSSNVVALVAGRLAGHRATRCVIHTHAYRSQCGRYRGERHGAQRIRCGRNHRKPNMYRRPPPIAAAPGASDALIAPDLPTREPRCPRQRRANVAHRIRLQVARGQHANAPDQLHGPAAPDQLAAARCRK